MKEDMLDTLAFSGEFKLDEEVDFWIKEVEAELREIDRQQHQLIRERTKYEGTLLWLRNLSRQKSGDQENQ